MSLKSFGIEKFRGFAINYIIGGLESGRYGAAARRAWFALKGKKTVIGFGVACFGATLTAFPDPSTVSLGASLTIVGGYLAQFGLVAKGAERQPPQVPEELREAVEFVLSGATYAVEILVLVAGAAVFAGYSWAEAFSLQAFLIAKAISTATGLMATWLGNTPKPVATPVIEGDTKP